MIAKLHPVNIPMTVDTGGAYADGDVLSQPQFIQLPSRAGSIAGVLRGIVIADIDNIAASIDFLLFSAAVVAPANNEAVALTDAEWATFIRRFTVADSQYTTYEDVALADVSYELYLPASFYVLPVIKTADTFTTTSAITANMLVEIRE